MRVLPYAALVLFLPSVLHAQQQQPAPEQAHPTPQAKPEEPKPKQTSAPPKKNRTRVVTNLAGFDLLEAKKVSSETIVIGATRAMPQPLALAPHLGKLYGTNPTLSWSYEGTAAKFVFVLSDDARAEVYRAEINGTQFRYPAGAPTLQPGKIYFWTVTTLGSLLGASSSDPSGMSVVSTEQREEIEKKVAEFPGDSYQAGLARAQVLTDYRLWYDAIAAYTDLINRNPNRELYEQRGTIYAQLDVTQKLAEQDFKLADDFRGKK